MYSHASLNDGDISLLGYIGYFFIVWTLKGHAKQNDTD